MLFRKEGGIQSQHRPVSMSFVEQWRFTHLTFILEFEFSCIVAQTFHWQDSTFSVLFSRLCCCLEQLEILAKKSVTHLDKV